MIFGWRHLGPHKFTKNLFSMDCSLQDYCSPLSTVCLRNGAVTRSANSNTSCVSPRRWKSGKWHHAQWSSHTRLRETRTSPIVFNRIVAGRWIIITQFRVIGPNDSGIGKADGSFQHKLCECSAIKNVIPKMINVESIDSDGFDKVSYCRVCLVQSHNSSKCPLISPQL